MIIIFFILPVLGGAFVLSMNLSPRRAVSLYPTVNTILEINNCFCQMFFEIVESGLKDRFKDEEISRVYNFCRYAKDELPKPTPAAHMHDPCEEYIDGLTAKPWWEPNNFDWIPGLERRAPEIMKELQRVIGGQEVFIGTHTHTASLKCESCIQHT
jgi:hypothetical protein